jgi:uncharacterized membrane protein
VREAAGPARLKVHNDLLLVDILTLLLVIIVFLFPSSFLRIVLGLPFVLFFPGYALIAALFPRKSDQGGIERLALSLGLSIAIVPLIGLALNYTVWGIRIYPILISVSAFTLITSSVAWYRRRRLPEAERIRLSFKPSLAVFKAEKPLDRVLSVLLALSILAALGTLVYAVAKPKVGERFTEFYILGAAGQAADYPTDLRVGASANVTVAVVNREHEEASYRVEVRDVGALINEAGPIVLQHEEKWEQPVSFALTTPGESRKIEFLLFKSGGDAPYRELHLWVNVEP